MSRKALNNWTGIIVNSIRFIRTTEKHWQQRQRDTVRFDNKRFEMNNEIKTSQVEGDGYA